jgi:hypothetical protein
MNKLYLILISLFLLLTPSKAEDFKTVLKQIQKGFEQNNAKLFSNYFDDNCYLSLNNGISGYYTSNQAYYIFEKYFSTYKILEFKVVESAKSNIQVIIEIAVKYVKDCNTNTGQVLITLKNYNDKFLITQIFIS